MVELDELVEWGELDELVKLGGLVFLEYGVVGEVGGYLVCCRGKDVTWCAEWVGVIRLSGPANEGVAVACSRGCGDADGLCAVGIVGGGSIDLTVSHPSDGIGGACDLEVGFGRVGAVAVGEVGDEAVGEGVAVGWPHGGSG